MQKSRSGFTIVELLIVIVVIGILAAIIMIAYNGIQNRANDTAVQSDLSQLQKKIELFYVLNDRYPTSQTDLIALEFKASKGAYSIGPANSSNLIFCTSTSTPATNYAVLAQSRSGSAYYIMPGKNVTTFPAAWTGNFCAAVLPGHPPTYNVRGYADGDITTGPWRGWVGGN